MQQFDKPYLIAEAGCNHKGDMSIARDLIETAACYCKADAIKFQKRCNRELLTEQQYNAPHPNPANSYGKTYGEHREFLEFDVEQHAQLKKWCEEAGITYSTSVWDLTSAKEIASLKPEFIKIPSACNNNYDMLSWLCENYEGEIQVSLGMTTHDEERRLVDLFEEKGRAADLTVFSCTSGYPVPYEDVCLLEIERIIQAYGDRVKRVGFSGHHLGIAVDVAAYALGARVIERHFTLDKTWKGTDHAASLEPDEMRKLGRDLRDVSESLRLKSSEVLGIEAVQREKLKYRKQASSSRIPGRNVIRENLEPFTVNEKATIMEALRRIDANTAGFLVVLRDDSTVLGTLTDGDIRRSIIRGVDLGCPICDSGSFKRGFTSLVVDQSVDDAIDVFKNDAIAFIPVLDVNGRLANILQKKQFYSLLLRCENVRLDDDLSDVDVMLVDFEVFNRPWGIYKTTILQDHYQSKILQIKPGAQLSLQYHERRDEHWTVASGHGIAQVGEERFELSPGSSVSIPRGCKHRLANTSDTEYLVVSEVQVGDYFGEDDVVRIEDMYGRACTPGSEPENAASSASGSAPYNVSGGTLGSDSGSASGSKPGSVPSGGQTG